MSTARHVARAVGITGGLDDPFRVDMRVGRHRFVADEPTPGGGGDAGPSPFGLLLSGLTACTAITLRMYAARKGWTLETIEVDARYDINEDGTAGITRIITLPSDLSNEQRERLAEISERTPVTLAVRNGVPITTTVRGGSDG